MESIPALRVAIVGVGPRGMFALERLLHYAAPSPDGAPLLVDLFEPSAVPGAGPVYDPRQPDYLRMNIAARLVNAWWPDGGAVPEGLRRTFVEWCAERASGGGGGRWPAHDGAVPPADADGLAEAYVPRALVGEYLTEAFALLIEHAPANVEIRRIRARVRELVPTDTGWMLTAEGSDGPTADDYDEVLVAGAHRSRDRRSLDRAWTHHANLVGAVFPVEDQLGRDRVRPGATVAIRGFALTAIDAILALTEGRGGTFDPGLEPGTLRYTGVSDEPTVVLPFSRSGRPMRPKPRATGVAYASLLTSALDDARTAIQAIDDGRDISTSREAGDGVATVEQLQRILVAVAERALASVDAPASEHERLAAWGSALAAADQAVPTSGTPADELQRGWRIAVGLRPGDAEWALGLAWRELAGPVVERFSGAPLGTPGWAAFQRLSTLLERVAYGPSPTNLAKLIALVDAGVVSLDHAVAGEVHDDHGRTWLRSAAGETPVDVVIDAVLPGPGVRGGGPEPLDRLLDADLVHVADGARGVSIGPDASCLDAFGTPIPGLAAIGRHTEDATVGNDTLIRRPHPQVDAWAARVVALSARPSAELREDALR